jgi:phosphatidate phosphatase APP1
VTAVKLPILLSFYAITNGKTTLLSGQLTYTKIDDLSFKDYSRRKTFRTLVSLYRTKPYASQEISLMFVHRSLVGEERKVTVKTDAYGSFFLMTDDLPDKTALSSVKLTSGGEVRIMEGLYPKAVQEINADVIVISDIDDTLLHSFIYRKLHKFRTLMFTTMEKRKVVTNMQDLLHRFDKNGAAFFYLSNSEQNLHPLIYRFLQHNNFPAGPLFLKKLRGLWDVMRNIKFPLRNIHKEQTLKNLLALFPQKKFVLMGDNTQYDLLIYLTAAEQFPDNIKYIVIRKVVDKKSDDTLIEKHANQLKINNTTLYYSEKFPFHFQF